MGLDDGLEHSERAGVMIWGLIVIRGWHFVAQLGVGGVNVSVPSISGIWVYLPRTNFYTSLREGRKEDGYIMHDIINIYKDEVFCQCYVFCLPMYKKGISCKERKFMSLAEILSRYATKRNPNREMSLSMPEEL